MGLVVPRMITNTRAVLGLDVGGTLIRAGIYDGQTLQFLEAQPTPRDYEAFLGCIAEILRQAKALVGSIGRFGLGLPGVWLGETILWVPNITCLEGKRLIPDLERQLEAKAVLANDAQMALLGECWQGAAQGHDNALLVSLGTGIGGALMVGARIVRGAHGSAGAFGWLTLGADDQGDPNHGALERQASGTALERLGCAMTPPRSSFAVVEGARRGETDCLEIVQAFGTRLGAAFAGIISALDPEVLIVSGGLSQAFDVLEPALRATVLRLASPNGRQVPIKTALLGVQTGVYGAIHAASTNDEVFI